MRHACPHRSETGLFRGFYPRFTRTHEKNVIEITLLILKPLSDCKRDQPVPNFGLAGPKLSQTRLAWDNT
jgi:hypothetical protein